MVPFRPVAYRPSRLPVPATFLARPYRPSLGQTFDQYFGFSPALGDVIRLTFHGLTAYLGIYVGRKETGFLSTFGWFLGIGQGIGAIMDVVSLIERACGTHPPEPTQTQP